MAIFKLIEDRPATAARVNNCDNVFGCCVSGVSGLSDELRVISWKTVEIVPNTIDNNDNTKRTIVSKKLVIYCKIVEPMLDVSGILTNRPTVNDRI